MAERIAHAQTARASVESMADELRDLFGSRVLATILGIADAKAIRRYVLGEQRPQPSVEQHLRTCFQIAKLLQQIESASTIRAWFMGMNPLLEDRAPASLVRTEPERVMQAARSFVAQG
ncbi:MAG: XRE family transcriptional regulator [Dehalococcoidia bacterium]